MTRTRTRHAGLVLAACAVALGGCSSPTGGAEGVRTPADASATPSAGAAAWLPAHSGTARALAAQAEALREAASATPSATAHSAPGAGRCTADPADRPHCTMPPGARITPDGGDLDGDGVFEEHEPIGPAHQDPRANDGGRTSGEEQCAWLRQQNLPC